MKAETRLTDAKTDVTGFIQTLSKDAQEIFEAFKKFLGEERENYEGTSGKYFLRMRLNQFKKSMNEKFDDFSAKEEFLKLMDLFLNPKNSVGMKYLFGEEDTTFKE